MSQFGAPPDQYAPAVEAPRTSGVAIASLVCSLIFCCPLTTVIGIILGLVGLATISGKPHMRGKGMALAGIVLGVVFTGAQFYGGFTMWKNMIEPIIKGPNEALVAGFAGDYDGFRAGFTGPVASMSDAEMQAFIESLRGRYGEYLSCQLDESAQGPSGTMGQPEAPFPYVLSFDSGPVDSEAVMVIVDQQTGQFIMKFRSLIVFDPALGDIEIPSSITVTPSGTSPDADAGEHEGDPSEGSEGAADRSEGADGD